MLQWQRCQRFAYCETPVKLIEAQQIEDDACKQCNEWEGMRGIEKAPVIKMMHVHLCQGRRRSVQMP